MLIATVLLGLLAAALSAGFFWSYSFTVMTGLAATTPDAAIAAMRAINANIVSPGFAFVFFGPAVLALLAAVLALLAGQRVTALLAFVAAAIYAAGVLGVTFRSSIPLNAALDAATVTAEGAGAVWRGYVEPWTLWNHLRTASAALAFLVLGAAGVSALRG